MKLGIVQVSAYYPPSLGGQENAVQQLAEQLAVQGREVAVLTSTVGGGVAGTRREAGVDVTRMPARVFGHAPIMPKLPLALFKLLKSNCLVHLHIGQAFTPEMVWLATRFRRRPYIAELHIDFAPSGPAAFLLPMYKRFVLGPVLRRATAVVVLNDDLLRTVREKYNYKGPAVVMSNGIEERFFEINRPPQPKKPPLVLRLVFVGRLSKQKNLDTLLKAIARTPRQVHFDIVGEGEERPTLERLITKHHLQKSVKLHGRQPPARVAEFYTNASAMILPSLNEAQPLVLLEAMAAGLPIIGSDVPGIAEHIKDFGIVAPPTIEGQMLAFDKYYKQYAQLPEMTARGRTKAGRVRWPNLIKEYEALYETLA